MARKAPLTPLVVLGVFTRVLGVVGVLADGRKHLLALELCNGESFTAWKGCLDDLVARGLRAERGLDLDIFLRMQRDAHEALQPAKDEVKDRDEAPIRPVFELAPTGGASPDASARASTEARGDFVTVECRREHGRLIASSIAVAEQASVVIVP